ncbi:MAG: serine/threonine-protein phosphatase [Erysipelotrichaceae bacterium]|nr:serine/threonine-protein phosphatase [Erysipelotrichaceae bacterium]
MEYYCLTDTGLVREMNQDSYIAIANNYGDFLVLVADGIGGGKAGEVASGEVIKYFELAFKESGPFDTAEDATNYLMYHIASANKHVYDLSNKYSQYEGMGTTLTGIMMTSKGIITINCGDSRVYGFMDDLCVRLTNDHTLVNQMLEKGQITYEESINHPKKHYLVKAIGIFPSCSPDIHKVKDMDYYLICSDGLHAYVSDEEITKIVLDKEKSVQEKTEDLKDLALLKGGFDNITVVLVKR